MRSKRLETALFLVVGVLAGLAALLVVNRLQSGSGTAEPARAAAASRSALAKHTPFVIPPGSSVVARADVKRVLVYDRPNGHVKRRLHNPNSQGGRLVFLTKWPNRRWTWPGWVRVYLPVRPNGSTGFIRSSDVTYLLDRYSVVIKLGAHSIAVFKNGNLLLRTPIGVGRALTPTPKGRYYLERLIVTHKPNGFYGPYAFGTSAYSNVLTDFGGGPGQIGIHGTSEPELLGTDVSHGCIRVANEVIVRLAHLLPLGTPVTIAR
jgi:lipoprotein-anchoring transpeptidase ErfK/SrfK